MIYCGLMYFANLVLKTMIKNLYLKLYRHVDSQNVKVCMFMWKPCNIIKILRKDICTLFFSLILSF